MNTIAEPPNFVPARADWNTIFTEVNAWRGACLHHFSSVEMAVTETLLALSATSSGAGSIKLRHLIGQRFEDFLATIGPQSAIPDVGHDAFIALSQFREEHETFRALLCHGAIKVMVDPHDRWTLVIRSLSVRKRQAERNVIVMEQLEAQSRLASLKRDRQKVASTLGQLRKQVIT